MPIGPEHVADLVAIHRDPWVAQWYAGQWSTARAQAFAQGCARGWSVDGVAKWIAYERRTGALVGRGGLSRLGAGGVSVRRWPTWPGPAGRSSGWSWDGRCGRSFAVRVSRRRSAGPGLASRLTFLGHARSFRLPSATTARPGRSWSGWVCDWPARSRPAGWSRARAANTTGAVRAIRDRRGGDGDGGRGSFGATLAARRSRSAASAARSGSANPARSLASKAIAASRRRRNAASPASVSVTTWTRRLASSRVAGDQALGVHRVQVMSERGAGYPDRLG